MKDMLSFQERKSVNILYELMVEKDFITLKDVQTMNQCSDRTVLSDIHHIRDFWDGKIDIDVVDHLVMIKNRSLGKLQQATYDILGQSLPNNLLISIFFNPEEPMDFHALETHISTSHAQRTMSDINLFLKKHDLMISKSKGNHFIEGSSESHLRFFMAEFLIQTQNIMESFNNQTFMLQLLDIVNEAFEYQRIPLNELILNQFNLSLYVSILREKQGFKYMDKDNLFKDFDLTLPHDFPYTKKEIIAGLSLFDNFVSLYHKNLDLKNSMHKQIQVFIKKNSFEKIFIDPNFLTNPVYLFMILVFSNTVKLDRLLDRTKLFGEKSQVIQKKLFQSIIAGLDSFEPNIKNFILEHLNEIIFWVSLEMSDWDIRSRKKILVISDLGHNHAKDLKSFLEIYFGHHTFDTDSTLNGLSKELKERINDFDLLVSTTLLDFKTEVPLVEVDDFLSERDLAKIFMAVR